MHGDGAAIGFLCSDVIRRIFSPFSKCPWMLLSQSHGDCAGLVNYAVMALSPHFRLFNLNCFIVYLPLVFYDVLECLLPYCQCFCAPVCFIFQANDIPGKDACLEFYPSKCFTVS